MTLPLTIDGTTYQVVTHVYKPQGVRPFPLVIFSHGRAPLQADRENSLTRWSGSICTSDPDFTQVGRNASAVVVAVHGWAVQQPWVRTDRILLAGQSVGGLTAIAASALNLPGVLASVNFAGGAGGNPAASPGNSCKPENLTRTYASYGKLVKIPSLWLYAENDQDWGADAPQRWYAAFSAGGSDATLVQTGPLPEHDGHSLLTFGGRLWSVPLNAFVLKTGLLEP